MTRTSYIQLAIALVVVAMAVGLLVAEIIFMNQEYAHAERRISDISAKRLEAMHVRAAKEALPALAADELAIAQYFVNTDDIVPFLERLQSIGIKQGAAVEVLAVGGEPGKNDHRISVSLKISGSFDAVMRTLGIIEYSPFDIALANVTLDSEKSALASGRTIWTAAAVFTVGAQAADTAAKK